MSHSENTRMSKRDIKDAILDIRRDIFADLEQTEMHPY